jgi:transposase InsO family protein
LKKDNNKCALKIKWDLEEENINIPYQTVHKIIRREGLLRKYKIRKMKYKNIRLPLLPGELVEMDVKYVPDKIGNKQYYQYTAIDCASRWRCVKIYDQQANHHSILFLKEVMKRFSRRIRAIKTDNHSTFTNRYIGYEKSIEPLNPRPHAFDLFCMRHSIIHYLIDPGKPQQNGKVERSHRTDQKSFYDETKYETLEELRYKISLWNLHCNNIRHCALNGKTPNEMLKLLNT